MSKEITCPECQTANTPGSKFCNNCGHRLPPSTSLICPNCNTPNPRDRYYCDNCGSRLVQDKQVPKEPEEKPPLEAGTFFSLPARPPGQTGELDPLQIVPDWLKKQAEEADAEEGEEDLRQRMPKIEEVGPPKKMTDDLPDWLVDEHDSEPIIGSPPIITTEHYMNLVHQPEGEEDDEELAEAAEKANLPDWLTDLASDREEKVTQSDDLSTPDDALNEWLASISGGEAAESGATEAEDLINRLAGLGEAGDFSADWTAEEADEITTDWLSEAAVESSAADWAPVESDSLSGLEADDPSMGGEMFDWLAETLVDTGMLDSSTIGDSEPEAAESDDDWLTDFADAADEPVTPGAAEEAGEDWTGWLAETDEPGTDLSSWLDADGFDEPDDAAAQQDVMAGDEELSDWVLEITGEDEGMVEDTAVSPPTEDLPDWMAEFTTADSETFAQEIESKLESLDEMDSPLPDQEEPDDAAAADFTGAMAPPDSGLDEWLDDFVPADESEAAGLEEQPESASAVEPESLPDWLSDLDVDETLLAESSDSDDIFTDLFAPSATGSDTLDWMGDEAPEPEADLLPAAEEEVEAEPPPEPLRPPEPAETDWLAEMMEMGDEAFSAEGETAVTDQRESAMSEPGAAASDLFAADWPDEEADEAEEAAEPETVPSDLFAADSMLMAALDEELPDWLEELGSPTAEAKADEADTSVETGESMPEWIAQMKPGSSFSGTGLTETGGLSDPYADLPEELVGSELPDWLQDADEIAAASMPPLEESADIPEWLAESIPGDSEFTVGQGAEADEEWTAVLQALPPAAPIEERVFKADVPDWILALKPSKLTEETEKESLVQEGGPLSGIRDVIEIEPVIAEPRSNGAVSAFTVSQEQMSQATLLKQLALADKGTTQSFKRMETASSGWVRLLLAGLLLAAVLLGLLRPNLLQLAPAAVPSHLAAAHETIDNAAGTTVLLAVEYTPAMSGELDAAAEMILAQLAANGSSVVTVSQSAAGTAVAQRIAADQPTLGLLPGQSVGLRQLGECLTGEDACRTLTGRPLPPSLADVSLIVVLTGERDSLVGWLEQVALVSDIPVVAGVTQSLTPVARPYLNTAQLQGMIGGLPETAVYQQELLNQTPADPIMRQLSAQTLGQLLAAVLLLVGGLTFGTINLLRRSSES